MLQKNPTKTQMIVALYVESRLALIYV